MNVYALETFHQFVTLYTILYNLYTYTCVYVVYIIGNLKFYMRFPKDWFRKQTLILNEFIENCLTGIYLYVWVELRILYNEHF